MKKVLVTVIRYLSEEYALFSAKCRIAAIHDLIAMKVQDEFRNLETTMKLLSHDRSIEGLWHDADSRLRWNAWHLHNFEMNTKIIFCRGWFAPDMF